MRKQGGTPSRRDKYVRLTAISPPGVARGRFVGGHQSGLAQCKSPPLFKRRASSCSSQRQRQREPCGASRQPSAPTYLPLRCGFVRSDSRFGCAQTLLAGVLGFMGVFVCALRLYPTTPGWGLQCGCVCLGSGLGCALPFLAGLLGHLCVCVRAPLVPRHSWLGCAVWVCALGLRFRLRPATPGWSVGGCVCLCARSACTPPLLAEMCGVGARVWALVSAAPGHSWLGCLGVCVCVRAPLVPRHSWLGCAVWMCVLGLRFWLRPTTPGWDGGVCVCVCVRAPPVPRDSWLGCVVWIWVVGLGFQLCPATPGWGARVYVCVRVRARLVPRHSQLGPAVCGLGVAWHLFLCRGSLRVLRTARPCGTRWPLLLGTCPCALVVAGSAPFWRALWPRVGAPRVVRSGRSRCCSWRSRRCGAFPHPRGLRPLIY